MKLKPSEHQALVDLAKGKGLAEASLQFSKKRGWVYIHSTGNDSPFSFYRKKETKLNAQKKWEDIVTYYLSKVSRDTPSLTWEEVLHAFELWLKGNV